MGMQAGHIR